MTATANIKSVQLKLVQLSLAQLVALAKQKTNMHYQTIISSSKGQLVGKLATVPNVLKPVEAI